MSDPQRSPRQQQGDWIDTTRRAVPVLVMVAGLLGFVGAMAKWLITDTPNLQLMGICAVAGSGGYFATSLLTAWRSGTPPPLPEPPEPLKIDPVEPPPAEVP